MPGLEAQQHVISATRFRVVSMTVAGLPRRFRAIGQTTRFAIVGACLTAILAGVVGWAIDTQITQVVLGQTAERATDHVALAILSHLTEADFESPYSQAKLDELSTRLMPLLVRAHADGSRILRVNLFARDGTIIYSDLTSLRGRVTSPATSPRLARALAGSVAVESFGLGPTEDEDADLILLFGGGLETYVPVKLRGKVVGAYELHFDPALIRPAQQLVWATVGGGFVLAFLLVLASARLIFRNRSEELELVDDEFVAGREARATANAGGRLGTDLLRNFDLRTSNGAPNPSPGYCLTRREVEVLRMMATNRSYVEIAAELVISEETVRTHAKSILHKLRQPDRARAVAAATAAGFLFSGGTPGDDRQLPSGEPGVTPKLPPNSPLISESGNPSIGLRIVGPVEVSSSLSQSP